MNTDAALAVVDLALRYGSPDRTNQMTAELEHLGWIPEPMDGDDSYFDTTWQYPPTDDRWRVRTRAVGDEFAVVFSVITNVEATAVELADLTRSVIEQWSTSAEVSHTRDDTSDLWTDEMRWIELHLFRRVPAGAHKEIPPGLQLTVTSPER